MKAKEVLMRIWKNKKESARIILTDALFIASLFLVAYLFNFILPTEATIQSLFANGMSGLAVFITLSLVIIYISLIIAMYSFAKYVVFHELRQMTKKTRFDFSRLRQFASSNLTIFFVIVAFFALVMIFANIFSPVFGGFLGIFFIAYLYFYLNFRQSLFFNTKKYSVGDAFIEASKFKKYKGLLIFNAITIAGWAGIFYTTGSILLYYINSFQIAATAYEPYYTASNYITSIFFYFLFFFNRAYFYFAAGEK